MKFFFISISMSILLLTVACSNHEAKKEEAQYLVTNPIQVDTGFTREYVCQIRAHRHIEIRALERGYLKQIYVDEGQHVHQGQLMFSIMPNVYRAELSKAQAEARVAQIEYQNTKLLADENVVSTNELSMVQAKYEKAKAEVRLAQTHLGFTQIKAPFDGIMDHLEARVGSLLDEGDLLTTLSDNSKIWVYFNVPEAEYLDFMMSDSDEHQKQVKLLMANQQVFDQTGIVETIEGDFNNETGNIAFRATFPNPDGLLRHGETGNILMRIPLTNVTLIPQKATFEILDKKYVFVVDKNNTVHQREISIAGELPHLYLIEKGLTTGDKIMLEGLRKVKTEEQIIPRYMVPDSVYNNLTLYAE